MWQLHETGNKLRGSKKKTDVSGQVIEDLLCHIINWLDIYSVVLIILPCHNQHVCYGVSKTPSDVQMFQSYGF